MAAAPASSPVEFLLRRPSPRQRRRPPLAGAFFAPTGLSGAPLLRALASLAADLLAGPRPPSQRRNLDALTRRLALLSALLDSLLLALGGEGEGAFSDATNICFRELYVVLFRADLLVSYVASAGRAWALLRGAHLAASFRDLDAELAVVLDVLPAFSRGAAAAGAARQRHGARIAAQWEHGGGASTARGSSNAQRSEQLLHLQTFFLFFYSIDRGGFRRDPPLKTPFLGAWLALRNGFLHFRGSRITGLYK